MLCNRVWATFTTFFGCEVYSCRVSVSVNAVREISARCPLAMDADLLEYLSEYRTHREKSEWSSEVVVVVLSVHKVK